VLDKAAKSQ